MVGPKYIGDGWMILPINSLDGWWVDYSWFYN
jgi:hypothetical protein